MLLERLRRFLSVIASHWVHDDATTSLISGLMGEAERRKPGSTKNAPIFRRGSEGVSPPAHHPFLRLSTNAGNVNRRNSSSGGEFSRNRAHIRRRTFPRVACKSSALIASPPSTRTDAHDLTERATESRLIRKARLIRNISQ